MQLLTGQTELVDRTLVIDKGDKGTVEIPLSDVEGAAFHRSAVAPERSTLELRVGGESVAIEMGPEQGSEIYAAYLESLSGGTE
jgi:hypothetical protein